MEAIEKPIHQVVDKLQVAISQEPQTECPVKHFFLPKMYIRTIVMPAGIVAISKIHNSYHPYRVIKGKYAVYNCEDDFLGAIEAPYMGVTKPGARRVFQVIEDTTLRTYHHVDWIVGNENNLSEEEKEAIANRIEEMIIDKREIKELA